MNYHTKRYVCLTRRADSTPERPRYDQQETVLCVVCYAELPADARRRLFAHDSTERCEQCTSTRPIPLSEREGERIVTNISNLDHQWFWTVRAVVYDHWNDTYRWAETEYRTNGAGQGVFTVEDGALQQHVGTCQFWLPAGTTEAKRKIRYYVTGR